MTEAQQPDSQPEIVQLFPGSQEHLSPDKYSNHEFIGFYLSRWRHPSRASLIAQSVVNDFGKRGDVLDAWQARLNSLILTSPLYDNFDEMEVDPVIKKMIDYMKSSSKSKDASVKEQREAIIKLLDLRAVEIDPNPFRAKGNISDRSDQWNILLERLLDE